MKIVLYTTEILSEPIVEIGANQKIEVILNHGEFYLLRNSFGITGWWKPEDSFVVKQINGLYFAGD